jgi:hypothetical protein
LNSLARNRSLPGRLRQAYTHPAAGLGTGFRRLSGGRGDCASWRLGFRKSSFRRVMQIPLAHHPLRLGMTAGFLACYCPENPFGSGLAIGPRDIPPISPRLAGHMKLRLVAHLYLSRIPCISLRPASRSAVPPPLRETAGQSANRSVPPKSPGQGSWPSSRTPQGETSRQVTRTARAV